MNSHGLDMDTSITTCIAFESKCPQKDSPEVVIIGRLQEVFLHELVNDTLAMSGIYLHACDGNKTAIVGQVIIDAIRRQNAKETCGIASFEEGMAPPERIIAQDHATNGPDKWDMFHEWRNDKGRALQDFLPFGQSQFLRIYSVTTDDVIRPAERMAVGRIHCQTFCSLFLFCSTRTYLCRILFRDYSQTIDCQSDYCCEHGETRILQIQYPDWLHRNAGSIGLRVPHAEPQALLMPKNRFAICEHGETRTPNPCGIRF